MTVPMCVSSDWTVWWEGGNVGSCDWSVSEWLSDRWRGWNGKCSDLMDPGPLGLSSVGTSVIIGYFVHFSTIKYRALQYSTVQYRHYSTVH